MRIAWNEVGKKFFEVGVDRGVLYLPGGYGVAWNGLISVEESSEVDAVSYYVDGIRYLHNRLPGDFAASITAFTYPDEFLEFDGIVAVADSLYVADQPVSSRFGLSWRTGIGNDLDGTSHAYKIHIAYNLVAVPKARSYVTTSDNPDPTEFSWDISGVAPAAVGFRPTAHYIIDTRELSAFQLARLEDLLYGNTDVDAFLPDISQLKEVLEREDAPELTITDNGNGTWTASSDDPSVILVDGDLFQITSAAAIVLSETVYQLSDN